MWVKWGEFDWIFSEVSLAENFRALAILEEKLYQQKLRHYIEIGIEIGIRISFGFGFGFVLVSIPTGIFSEDLNALG